MRVMRWEVKGRLRDIHLRLYSQVETGTRNDFVRERLFRFLTIIDYNFITTVFSNVL